VSDRSTLGRRERNKLDKRRRILRAARALFSAHGFEGTTTRAISEHAEIATGTLFTYFEDKLTLLSELFVTEVNAVVEDAETSLDTHAALIDQLMHLFDACLTYYAQDIALSRVLVRELMFLPMADQVRRNGVTIQFIARLAALSDAAKTKPGPDGLQVHAETVGMTAGVLFFGQYFMTLVVWLSGAIPDRDTASDVLRAQLSLAIRGVAAPAPKSPV
jgi:AcrR family transcriptional regulator